MKKVLGKLNVNEKADNILKDISTSYKKMKTLEKEKSKKRKPSSEIEMSAFKGRKTQRAKSLKNPTSAKNPKKKSNVMKKKSQSGKVPKKKKNEKSRGKEKVKGNYQEEELLEIKTNNVEDLYPISGVELDGVRYGIGYKFDQLCSSLVRKKGLSEIEVVKGEVIEVLKNGMRKVTYDDLDMADDYLHVDNIKQFMASPKFQYSLRVGDLIEFKKFDEQNGLRVVNENVQGKVKKIAKPFWTTDILPDIETYHSSPFGEVSGNTMFRVVESSYEDVPPKDQWISLYMVNLVYGSLDQSEEVKAKKRKVNSKETLRNSIGGTEAAFKAAVYMGMSKPMKEKSANIYEAGLQSELSAQKDKVDCNTMAEKLMPGTWLVYKRCGDMEEPIRLGRAQRNNAWDKKCQWYNDSDKVVEFRDGGRALVPPKGYAVNIQWYRQKVVGHLDYVMEDLHHVVSSNQDLVLANFDNEMSRVKIDKGEWRMSEKLRSMVYDCIR